MKRLQQLFASVVIWAIAFLILYGPYWLMAPETFFERLVIVGLTILFLASWLLPVVTLFWLFIIAYIEDEL